MAVKGISNEFDSDRAKTAIYASSALVGVLSGLIIVAYRALIHYLQTARGLLAPWISASASRIVAWLMVAGLAALAVSRMVKAAPLIRGSGIPQVKATLIHRVAPDWKRELPFKFLGGGAALGVGMSLGREGPSIQMGSLVGLAIGDLVRKPEFRRYLVTAGAAAGISAAFNAPLAGVLFCIEELHRHISPTMLTTSLIASFCANAVMWAFYGNSPVFGISLAQVLPLNLYFTAVLFMGIVAGILGSLFNRGILDFQSLFRTISPSATIRIAAAFIGSAAIVLAFPLLAGGGENLIAALKADSFTPMALGAILAGKFIFTLFCYASGSPGGIFLPMLAIGALIGSISHAMLGWAGLPSGYLNNFILVGMAGFFTAVVRAPITGAVLITEMAGNLSHFPAFIFVSVVATLVAGLLRTKPIYDLLLGLMAPSGQDSSLAQPSMLHIPVLEGSVFDTCSSAAGRMPEGCLLVGIERGEDEFFPDDDMQIIPGDTLRVVVKRGALQDLQERLVRLGQASAEDTDHGQTNTRRRV